MGSDISQELRFLNVDGKKLLQVREFVYGEVRLHGGGHEKRWHYRWKFVPTVVEEAKE